MPRDETYLQSVLDLIGEIDALLIGVDESAFLQNDALRSAVLLKHIFVGEAMRNVSEELRQRYPAVRWSRIVGFRNVTVHRYWEVDWRIVWSTATRDAQTFREQVVAILAAEYPGEA